MTQGTTFIEGNYGTGILEVGFDYEEIGGIKHPVKINYIEKNGKDLDLSEYEVDDLASMLQVFFNMDDCSDIAEAYFMNAEIY